MTSTPRRTPRRRTLRRRGRRLGERGSSPVEFAIIAGAMLMLAFMVIQAGLTFYANSIALGAATQGVNVERGYLAAPGSGAAHANDFLNAAGLGLTNRQVTVTRTATDVQVTVTGRAISVLPFLTWNVRRTAHGSVERVTQP